MATPPLSPQAMREAVEAVQIHGSQVAAARALGLSRGALRNRLSQAQRRRADAPPAKPRIRVQMPRSPDGYVSVLAIGDAHDSPELSHDRFTWIGRLAAERKPDWIVSIGDLLTLDSLNSHIGNQTVAGRLKGRFIDDIASGAEALRRINAELPDGYKPRRHMTRGNHEERLWRFEDGAPEVAGLMQAEFASIMERNGWTHSPFGAFHFIGGVGFTHAPLTRMGRPYGGQNAEIQIANHAVFDVVFGHTHVAREWTAPKIGPSQFVRVVNLGSTLPDGHVEAYAQHNATGWTWCVTMLRIAAGHIQEREFISMDTLSRRYA